jgi:hypothetical protein
MFGRYVLVPAREVPGPVHIADGQGRISVLSRVFGWRSAGSGLTGADALLDLVTKIAVDVVPVLERPLQDRLGHAVE